MKYEICEKHDLPKDRVYRVFLIGVGVLNRIFVCRKCRSDFSNKDRKGLKKQHKARTKFQLTINENRLLEKERASKLIKELQQSRQ